MKKFKRIDFRFTKKIRRYCKKGLVIVLLSSLLIFCVFSGFFYNTQKEVHAFGGVAEYAYGQIFEMITALASFAGGGTTSEVLETKQSAGITDMDSARKYVNESTVDNSNFTKMFSFESIKQQVQFSECLAKAYLSGVYVLNKDWMNNIWDQWVDGSSAIDISSHVSDIPAEVIQFPTPDNDNDDNDNDDDDPDVSANPDPDGEVSENFVFPPSLIPACIGSSTFASIFSLVRSYKCQDALKKFTDDTQDEDVCNYSYDYFLQHPDIFCIFSQNFTPAINNWLEVDGMALSFSDKFLELSSEHWENDKIFPCTFVDNGVEYLGIVTSNGFGDFTWNSFNDEQTFVQSSFLHDIRMDTFGTDYSYSDSHMNITSGYFDGTWVKYAYEPLNDFLNFTSTLNYGARSREFLNMYRARFVINPQSGQIALDNFINCNTFDNFVKFSELVQTTDYSVEQLLEFMQDGWKGIKTTHMTGVDNKGETAKKTLEDSDKSKKYTTSGKGKDKNGKTVNVQGVTFDSLMNGVISSGSGQDGQAAFEIIGDPIQGTPVEYPTNPNPDIGTNPGTNPDPGTNPGTGGDPDSGSDTDPDKKPGQGTDPESGSSTNPGEGTDPDSGSDTDPDKRPGEGTDPDTDDKGGGSGDSSDDDEDRKPIVPGSGSFGGGASGDDAIQWYERFPFCIPWDIYNGVSSLNAKTKVPKFSIPFKYKKLNVDYKLEIDFSEYETLAIIIRWFLRLSFIAGLVMISRYIVKG